MSTGTTDLSELLSKITVDSETNQITSVSCENSFQDLDSLTTNNVQITDPPLMDYSIDYYYEIFLADNMSPEMVSIVLADLEERMFVHVLAASPWVSSVTGVSGDDDGEQVGVNLVNSESATCNHMLFDTLNLNSNGGWGVRARALKGGISHIHGRERTRLTSGKEHDNDNETRTLHLQTGTDDEDWSNYLGWKNDPATDADTIVTSNAANSDTESELVASCQSEESKAAYAAMTCLPIHGKVTAQLPVDSNPVPLAIEMQIMGRIKDAIDNNVFVSSSDNGAIGGAVQGMVFRGKNSVEYEDKTDNNRDDSRTGDGNNFFSRFRDGSLSEFGITYIVALAAAVLLVVVAIRHSCKRRKLERELDLAEKEKAKELGEGSGDDAGSEVVDRNVMTLASPHSVEVIEDVQDSGNGKNGGLFIDSLMESFRGCDDLSFCSGLSKGGNGNNSVADDSALSVGTEDMGTKEEGDLDAKLGKPYSPSRFRSKLA